MDDVVSELLKIIVDNAAAVAITVVAAFFIYEFLKKVTRKAIVRMGGTLGDANMLSGLLKLVVSFATLIYLLTTFFPQFGVLSWLFGTFGGLVIGWSLQSPVAGFAAWLLITIKRPFKLGDRVQFPSFGLVGDVIEVGPMYTVLNQVGGSVGSEEAVGRHVLIPNAMLFSNLVVNYTPKEVQQQEVQTGKGKVDSYILDEVVLRITFDSDWNEAERILLNAAREVTKEIIEATGHQPYVRGDMGDWYGVHLRLRFMTLATDRPRITHEICKRVFDEVQSNDKVDLAIPYVYSFKKPIGSTRRGEAVKVDEDERLKFLR